MNFINRFNILKQFQLRKGNSVVKNVSKEFKALINNQTLEILKKMATTISNNTMISLNIATSTIANAGNGVYTLKDIKKDTVVAFYPGTMYLPNDPCFLVSLNNHYILQCYDGILIDGKNKGNHMDV